MSLPLDEVAGRRGAGAFGYGVGFGGVVRGYGSLRPPRKALMGEESLSVGKSLSSGERGMMTGLSGRRPVSLVRLAVRRLHFIPDVQPIACRRFSWEIPVSRSTRTQRDAIRTFRRILAGQWRRQ